MGEPVGVAPAVNVRSDLVCLDGRGDAPYRLVQIAAVNLEPDAGHLQPERGHRRPSAILEVNVDHDKRWRDYMVMTLAKKKGLGKEWFKILSDPDLKGMAIRQKADI